MHDSNILPVATINVDSLSTSHQFPRIPPASAIEERIMSNGMIETANDAAGGVVNALMRFAWKCGSVFAGVITLAVGVLYFKVSYYINRVIGHTIIRMSVIQICLLFKLS